MAASSRDDKSESPETPDPSVVEDKVVVEEEKTKEKPSSSQKTAGELRGDSKEEVFKKFRNFFSTQWQLCVYGMLVLGCGLVELPLCGYTTDERRKAKEIVLSAVIAVSESSSPMGFIAGRWS